MEKRNRVIFTLKNLGTTKAIDVLKEGLTDPSVLLAHEVAYCLGQTRNAHAVPYLVNTLKNDALHPMVRHEAAEALGAIGGENAESTLREYLNCSIPEIRDTCQIAVNLIEWKNVNKDDADANASHPVFLSVDPAPPLNESENVQNLGKVLLNTDLPLFERYRALFALRNVGTPEAIKFLGEALHQKSSGAVFTHEVAYVLGQMQDKLATQALSDVLADESLNCMVRHEAAEALGSIAEDQTIDLLKKFTNDKEEPVSASCVVALDILNYVKSDQFQYADGLTDN
uniref:Deoxyhypusine hydroxylase n=1 Tax=Arcella intermedia TaxID=1963864 RepID=A0A6B2LC13_9EUKA